MKPLLLLPLLCVLLQACNKDAPADKPQEPIARIVKPADFFPMKVGNYWVYEVGSNNNVYAMDTVRIERDSIFKSRRYYYFSSNAAVIPDWYADSSGYIVNAAGRVEQIADGTMDTLLVEDVIDIVQMVYRTGNRDTVITTPAGIFHCLQTIADVHYDTKNWDVPNPRPRNAFRTKDVGLIKCNQFSLNSEYENILTLKAYHLQP